MRAMVTSLVQQALKEFFQANKAKDTHKKIFILLSYECKNKEFVWNNIRSIDLDHDISLGVTNEWQNVPESLSSSNIVNLEEIDKQELLELLGEADLIYVPVMSFGLLAKIALTIDDDVISWLIIQMQFRGRKILFANDALSGDISRFHASLSVENRIQSYFSQLIKDGIEVLPMSYVGQKITSISNSIPKQPLLLAKHIEALHRNGDEGIVLPKRSLITPLGKDRARELGITIQQIDDEKRN